MKPLSDAQYEALGRTRKKAGVPVSGPRKHGDGPRMIPEGCISPQVANVLIDAGFAQMVDGTLRSTKAGRLEFDKPRAEGPPIYLARGGGIKYRTLPNGRQVEDMDGAESLSDHGYTTSRSRSADELETMEVGKLRKDWLEHSAKLHAASRRDTDAARLSGLAHPEERLAELRRMAAERGQDVASELKRVELTRKAHDRAVRSLERKITEEEAA